VTFDRSVTLHLYFVPLYKSKVRPHIEYANALWSPYKKRSIEDIEKNPKRATKLIISLKHLSHKDYINFGCTKT